MYEAPSVELAVKISDILIKNKAKMKQYQDRHGNLNFNLLVGLVLAGICAFEDKPIINSIIKIFMPAFKENQLNDYAKLMMQLNNTLVNIMNTNPNNIHVLENGQWIVSSEAEIGSLYSLWYAFFGIMKVEFESAQSKIKKVKDNPVTVHALECFSSMSKIMTSNMLSPDDLEIMENKFPAYAQSFNELRKLMYMQDNKPTAATIH